ncbi:MAG: GNAT family N-acetyltransferase [Pseudomonadota bacterium]|nr:GNAT family N-acetyltransferase [Pseudomonadota bacterium]
MNSPLYRPAVVSDAAGIAQMHAEAIRGTYGGVYHPLVIQDWAGGHTTEKWEKLIQDPRHLFMVAELDGQIVGCCGLNIKDEDMGVYVHPRCHRLGIGRKLMQVQLDNARARGIKTLHLSAVERTVPFYESLGFQALEPSQHMFRSGHSVPVVNMRMAL